VFAQRYPRYLIRIVNRHEEFYAMIMFFVERHYLYKHSESCNQPMVVLLSDGPQTPLLRRISMALSVVGMLGYPLKERLLL
jgi:hypothetical protein